MKQNVFTFLCAAVRPNCD